MVDDCCDFGDDSCAPPALRLPEPDLARNAQRLFAKQEPREKRRLLNFVRSNCTWEDGEIVTTFRQPFDMLAETVTAAATLGRAIKPNRRKLGFGCPS